MRLGAAADQERMSLGQKLWQVSWSLVLLFCLAAGIGFAMLYSAADGSWEPWEQDPRGGAGLCQPDRAASLTSSEP